MTRSGILILAFLILSHPAAKVRDERSGTSQNSYRQKRRAWGLPDPHARPFYSPQRVGDFSLLSGIALKPSRLLGRL